MDNTPASAQSTDSNAPTQVPVTPTPAGAGISPASEPVSTSSNPVPPTSVSDAKTAKKNKKAMWAFIALVILVLIVGGTAAYWNYQNMRGFSLDTILNSGTSPAPTVSPSSDALDSAGNATSSSNVVLSETFTDSGDNFTFSYPEGYTLDEMPTPELVRVFKVGPTQTGQTEMYDGVIVNFELVNLGGQTLQQWVEAQLDAATQDGTVTVVTAPTPTTVNGFPAISYTTQSLGSFETVVVQNNAASSQAVSVTSLVADPTNAGFQAEADAIIQSLQLLK